MLFNWGGGFVCCLTGGGICVLFNWRGDLCVV